MVNRDGLIIHKSNYERGRNYYKENHPETKSIMYLILNIFVNNDFVIRSLLPIKKRRKENLSKKV